MKQCVCIILTLCALFFGLTACGGQETVAFSTTLTDGQVVENAAFSFAASASRGKKILEVSATANGEILERRDGVFIAQLDPGGNRIELAAGGEKRSYSVTYRDPFVISTSLADCEIASAELAFTAAALYAGQPCSLRVTCNGAEVPGNGGRYTAALAEGENLLVLTASCNGQTRVVTVTVVRAFGGEEEGGERIGQAVVSVEAFTVGKGYLVYPASVPLYEGEPLSLAVMRALTAAGLGCRYSGTPENSFYLNAVTEVDMRANRVPDALYGCLEGAEQSVPDSRTELGEFDFAPGSGWMYSVNGDFPGVGMSDWFAKDGDCVRVQFTLCLGADVGGEAAGTGAPALCERLDFNRVLPALAGLGASGVSASDPPLAAALAVLTRWGIVQSELDAALDRLAADYGLEGKA